MRIKIIRPIAVLTTILTLAFAFSMPAMAASSDSWSVNYTKGAPTASANPVDYLYVAYSSDGYKGTCNTLNGSADRLVKITATNSGGINNTNKSVTFTTTASQTWKTKTAISSNVTFKVVASGTATCSSTGVIKQR